MLLNFGFVLFHKFLFLCVIYNFALFILISINFLLILTQLFPLFRSYWCHCSNGHAWITFLYLIFPLLEIKNKRIWWRFRHARNLDFLFNYFFLFRNRCHTFWWFSTFLILTLRKRGRILIKIYLALYLILHRFIIIQVRGFDFLYIFLYLNSKCLSSVILDQIMQIKHRIW